MIKFYYLLLLSLCISFVYAQPPNDQCIDAQLLTNGAVFSGDSTGSTTTGFETCEPGVDRDFPVFFSYTTAINNGAISILTAGSSYDTELSVYDVCGGTCLAFNDDLDGFAGTTSEIYFTNVPVGTDYIIALTGISDTTGSYDILLTETAPPANDECVDATVLTENVLSSGSNFGSLTTGLTNCNGDTRDSPVFFSYTSGGNGLVAIDTSGSDFDTELSVYDACNGNCIAFNDDGGTGSDSLIIIGDAGAGVEYIIAITGFNSAFGDYDIIVTEQATAANDECSEAFELSNGSTFTGDTTNSEIISFIDCSGNTRTRAAFFTFTFPENSEVIISTVGSAFDTQLSVYDACNGNCIAFNDDFAGIGPSLINLVGFPGGQITIALAGFLDTTGAYDITATSTPSNDECGDAIPLTNGVSEFGNNEDSVTVLSNCNLDSRDFPVFFTYTTTMANSFITIDTEGSDFDTELSVFSGICTTSCLAFNDDGGSGLLSLIALTDIGPAGTQITIVITGASSDTGNYQITLNEVPSLDNDKCSDAFELSNGVSITGTNSNSETLNFENCNSETKDFPVFFTYTTTIPNSFVVVNTSGSIIDTQLSIYDSCDGNCIAFNEDGGTGSASLVTLGPVTSVGTQFVIVITEFFSAQGPYQIIVTENVQPPSHPNDICSEAIALSNEVTFFGNSENSQTLDYTTCEPRDRDHPVFFSYTSTMEESLIAIFSSGEFDTEISVLTGCTGTCLSFGFGSVGIFNVGPIGTQIIIVLTQGFYLYDYNGAYSITVFESVGSSNSLCDNAIKLSTDIPYFDTNTNSPTQDTNCNGDSRNSVVYYEYTTLGEDVVEITTDGSDFDTELSVFDACGGTCLGFDNDGIASSGPSLLIFNGLPAGTNLIIMVSGFDSETGNIEITAFEYPVINGNIDCDSAFILTNNTAVSDTQEAGIPFTNCISSTATNYAVFNYTTQLTNGEVIIDTCDSNSDTEISVFSDCSLTTCTGFNDDAFSPRCSGSPSVIEFNTLPVGTTLIIYVNDFNDIVRQFNIRVTESIPIPPTNANCSTAETLAIGIPFFGDNLDSETSILNCDGNFRNTAVFFEYTSTLSDPNSVLSISTCGSVIDTEISVFDACGGSCVSNGFNDDGFSSSICDEDSFVNLFAVPFNTTFIIVLTEFSDAEGPYTIVVNEFIRINDQCATVIPLTAGVLQSGSNRNSIATDDNLCGTTYDFSVGYSFTTQIDQAFIVIEITDNNFQVDITLLSGGCSGCITSASDLLEFSSPDPSGTLYDIIIANSNGDVGEFSITVHEFSPPSNDECSDATTLVNNVPIIGSNFASATLGFTTCSPDIRDFAVFYTYTTQFDFSGVTIETFGSAMDTELSVFDSCGGNCLAFNDDTTTGLDSLVVLNELNIGTTLIIAVTGFNSDFGKFNLLLSENPLPSNYKCTTPRLLFNGGSLQGTTEFSTSFWDLDLPDCTPDFPAHSPVVFYSYTSVFSFGNITVDTCGSGTLDTYIELFTGSCSSLTCLASGNNDFCGTKSSLTLNEAQRVDIGTNIIIAVHSPDTRDGTFTIIVNEEEVFEPVNDDCNLAIPLVNHVILESNTEDSETLRNSLPSCGTPVSSNNSPATFYSYTTQFQYGSIEISTCDGSKFDTYISLFTGSCGALSCIAENDDACGPSSIINVPFENRQPQGTVLYIVVAGKPGDIEGGEFTIVLHENGFPQPPNSACSNAITLFNDDAAAGTTLGSGTLSGQIPNCGSLSTESPTVFYTYTTQSTDSDLTISTCLGGDFDTIISVYTGSCSGLQCVADNDDSSSCGLLSEVSLSSLPAGTQLFIAVTGKPLNAGEFVLQVFEDDVCSLDPPEYQCTTSFSVLTDHKCGNNIQCATIPDYSIGSCFDKEGCSCTTTQTSTDVFPNDEKVAGRYTVTSIGTNAAGVQTDECSFGITVVDSCFANGPKIQCSNDVTFTTSPECSIAPNQHCTRLPPIFLASCSDNTPYCNCVVNQVSGAEPGDLLISGIYPITVEGTNDAGYTSQCSFNVIIE